MPERKKHPTSVFENALLPGLFPLCVLSFGLSYHHILTISCLLAFFSLLIACLGHFLESFSLCGFFLPLQLWLQVAIASLSQLTGVSLALFCLFQ